MVKVETLFRFLTLFIGIMSSIMGVEGFYANLLLVQKGQYVTKSYLFMFAAFCYTIFCLFLIRGTLEQSSNWMIPWLIFIPGGGICYSQFFTSLINNTGAVLIGLVLCIFNWTIVLQLYLNDKKCMMLDSNEDEIRVA